jgi:serine/threonine protein kinase
MTVARRRFRFIKEIAEGGFGKVYLAEQITSDGFSRIVAIKLLHAKWSSHDEIVMRTRDEARLLGLIRHQNIVKVEDLTSIDGKCAIVMEYLEGVDLKGMSNHLREQDIEFPRTSLFEIMATVASALDAAYNGRPLQGGEPLRVIHRDIKPSNIFVTIPGSIKVLDFGTARANFTEREAKTQALAFGSQGYMAPERVLGEEDTPAADVFSLGITLYELLSLENFGRISPRPQKFQTKVEERVAALPLHGPDEWQEQVREVLRLMLSFLPAERPSALQLVDIFELLADSADDMPVRRFCRTLVADAKAAIPDLDTGDPLPGRVVDEDVSSAFGMGTGQLDPVTPPPATQRRPPPPPPPAPVAGTQSIAPQVAPRSLAPTSNRPVGHDLREAPATSRGAMTFAVAGFGLVVVLVLLLVVGVGIALAVLQPWNSGVPDVRDPEPVVGPAVMPDEVVAVPCVVTEDDASAVHVPVTLTVSGSVTEVTFSQTAGLRAEWDGQGTCQMSMLGGRMSTNVTPTVGSRLRRKTFEIDQAAASCAFDFNVASEEWIGSCATDE